MLVNVLYVGCGAEGSVCYVFVGNSKGGFGGGVE